MRKIEKIESLFLNILGINNLFRFLNRKKAIILAYHGICDDDFTLLKDYDERHISKAMFKKQLSYLKKKGYVFVTISELIDILKNRKKIKKPVALIFDDGYSNVVENAYPIMKELGAKGCFFVVSDLISKDKLLWVDHLDTLIRNNEKGEFQFIFKGEKIIYRLDTKASYEKTIRDITAKLKAISENEMKEHMQQFYNKRIKNVPKEFLIANSEQIRGLNRNTLEVGAHTMTHARCATLTSEHDFEIEIKNSKIDIEKIVGYKIDHFSYPDGSFDDDTIKYVNMYGYKSAVTIIAGFNDENSDLYKLKRIQISYNNFLFFKEITSGSYFFMRRLMKILKGRR